MCYFCISALAIPTTAHSQTVVIFFRGGGGEIPENIFCNPYMFFTFLKGSSGYFKLICYKFQTVGLAIQLHIYVLFVSAT